MSNSRVCINQTILKLNRLKIKYKQSFEEKCKAKKLFNTLRYSDKLIFMLELVTVFPF